jgi:hypothetical protein
MLWLTDGNTTWLYRSDQNEYTQEPTEPWNTPSGTADGLPGFEWRLFAKFRTLAGVAAHAELLKDDIAPDATCTGRTALVSIDLSQLAEPVKEELRIDTKTGLVCAATTRVLRHVRVTPAEYVTHRVWNYRQLSAPDPSSFRFDPPKGAKRVSHFRRPL